MTRDYGFPRMVDLIPEGQCGAYSIKHRVVTEDEIRLERMRGAMSRNGWLNRGTEPGTYCTLLNGGVWMSDTWMERYTNAEVLKEARGDVLIAGLGIGMLPAAMVPLEKVRSVTVVEIAPEVISLVAPHIEHPKLTVIAADAKDPPLKGRTFDTVYLDIWQSINSDMWEDMKPLLRLYRRFARQGAYVSGWLKEYVQGLWREERR